MATLLAEIVPVVCALKGRVLINTLVLNQPEGGHEGDWAFPDLGLPRPNDGVLQDIWQAGSNDEMRAHGLKSTRVRGQSVMVLDWLP